MDQSCIFYTVPEARAILRVSRSHFYALMQKGVINRSKLGAKTLIARTEVDRLVAQMLPKPSTTGSSADAR